MSAKRSKIVTVRQKKENEKKRFSAIDETQLNNIKKEIKERIKSN